MRLPRRGVIAHTSRQNVHKGPEKHQKQHYQGAFHKKAGVLQHVREEMSSIVHAIHTSPDTPITI